MSRFVKRTIIEEPVTVDIRDVLGLSEAAKLLGLAQASSVADLCNRGVLTYVFDLHEPNPRKRGRVLRSEIERERARRSGADDGRMNPLPRGRMPSVRARS